MMSAVIWGLLQSFSVLFAPWETSRARQLSRLPTASAEQCAHGFAGRPAVRAVAAVAAMHRQCSPETLL